MIPLALLTGPAARIGAVSLLVVGAMASCKIQTDRLHHAKADLKAARAALFVPLPGGKPSDVTWKAEAERRGETLGVCQSDVQKLTDAVVAQNSAVEALHAEAGRKAAAAAQALQAARKTGATAQAEADRILAIRAKGDDVCARLLDAERQISEGSR